MTEEPPFKDMIVVKLDNKDIMEGEMRAELYEVLCELWLKEHPSSPHTIEDFWWDDLNRTAKYQAVKMGIKIPYGNLGKMGDLVNELRVKLRGAK